MTPGPYIVGACVFHNGILLQTHLNPTWTSQIHRYLHCRNIVLRKKGKPLLVSATHMFVDDPESLLIEYVYMEENTNPFGLEKSVGNEKNDIVRKEFILVILAEKDYIMCTVLDPVLQIIDQINPFFITETRNVLYRIIERNVSELIPKRKEVHSQMGIPSQGLLHYFVHVAKHGLVLFPWSYSNSWRNLETRLVKYYPMVREVLHMQRSNITNDDDNNSSNSSNNTTGSVIEYSIKIVDDTLIPTQLVTYWIAGRYSTQGEVYVCYEDSIPLSLVEMQLKMMYGMHTML